MSIILYNRSIWWPVNFLPWGGPVIGLICKYSIQSVQHSLPWTSEQDYNGLKFVTFSNKHLRKSNSLVQNINTYGTSTFFWPHSVSVYLTLSESSSRTVRRSAQVWTRESLAARAVAHQVVSSPHRARYVRAAASRTAGPEWRSKTAPISAIRLDTAWGKEDENGASYFQNLSTANARPIDGDFDHCLIISSNVSKNTKHMLDTTTQIRLFSASLSFVS